MIEKIKEKIEGKRDVYLSIIAKSHECDLTRAEQILDSELEMYVVRLFNALEKDKGSQITVAKGVNIFIECMQSGLSISESSGHVYITRLKGSGTSLAMQVTIDGDIYLAQKAGAIHHLTEPVIVRNGDDFKIVNTPDGRQIAIGEISFDEQKKFILSDMKVGYVYIVYPNGDRELSWINRARLEEYQKKSQTPGMYNDESFIQTKILKHALRKVSKTAIMRTKTNESYEVMAQNREIENDYPEVVTEPEPIETNNSEPF